MSVMDGCEAKYRTPKPVDKTCPKCGKTVEVFENRGRIVEDVTCECGYVFHAEDPDPIKVERKEDK